MDTVSLPDLATAAVVVPAPGGTPGCWTGAPAAVLHEGTTVLAYRVRRPLDQGRGVGVVVATSQDGVTFRTVATVGRETIGAASLERPAIVRLDDGWRLYLSCSTPSSKHWWVECLTAPTLEDLPDGERHVVLPGDEGSVGVKDPVIVRDRKGWRCWLCCHPLDEPGHEDRMTTSYLTSEDGLVWQDHGTVLRGRPGEWDARGARVTSWVRDHPLTLTYDGRPDAEHNWFETTGLVRGERYDALHRVDGWRLSSPFSDGAFRYACAVPQPDGSTRWYAEMARRDGAHDLVTLVTR